MAFYLSRLFRPTSRLCYNNLIICNESNYQSSISLKNLYPNSSLRLTTINSVPENPEQRFNGYIPIDALKITYSRSSGPGGQHVNTVNTKVDLRFHLETAEWLDPLLRAKMAEIYKTRISKDGFLILRSEKTRSQQLNLADCMENLRAMIRKAGERPAAPSPETEEKIRRRREKANQMRLMEKRTRAAVKASRQEPAL